MSVVEIEKSEEQTPGAGESMRAFLIIWIGQMFSVLGSALTTFGIGVWLFERTHTATSFTLMALAMGIPSMIMMPVAGALVDRWDRRVALIVSEVGAGATSLILATLVLLKLVQPWEIYGLMALSATFGTLAWPAMSAAVTMLVPKQHLGRANSLLMFNQAISGVLGPVIGGVFMVMGGLASLVIADVVSFAICVVCLSLVRVPKPVRTVEHVEQHFFKEAFYGWTYIKERPGLMGLVTYFMTVNFVGGVAGVLFMPLALTFFTADVAGRVSGASGIGMILGTVVMAAWGGFKKRVNGVLGIGIISALTTEIMILPPSAFLLTAVSFTFMFWMPIVNTSSQSIWQSKVAPDVQGRVFAIRSMIAQFMQPLAFGVAGPLADHVFTPGMMPGGALAPTFGPLIGTGPGAGIRLIFVLMGAISASVAALKFLNPHIRNVETELPDFVKQAA